MEYNVQTFIEHIDEKDPKLAKTLQKIVAKLEAYYPEHQVFSLSAIDDELRDRLSKIYKDCGCGTVEELLQKCDFSMISGDAVKSLRSSVLYRPGEEPDIIKEKVDSILGRLAEYYPDHHVPAGLDKAHKSLSSDITGVYQWLGYQDRSSFLSAYGYTMELSQGGRPEQDFQPILDALAEKYRTQPKPKTLGALIFENPEYKSALKTLQNRSVELFGMTLKKYLQEVGIFAGSTVRASASSPNKHSVRAQALAEELLQGVYADLDPAVYGTWEEAAQKLGDLSIRRHSSGGILLRRVEENCPAAVEIPYGVTKIAVGAFQGQEALKNVTLPGSVDELGEDTFAQCISLTSVTLPEGLTAIRKHAFSGCTALRSITLPASLQVIEDGAFDGCSALAEVNFLNRWTVVGKTAFSGCPFQYQPPEADGEESLFTYEISTTGRNKGATVTGYLGTDEKIRIPQMLGGTLVVAIGKEAFKGNQYLTEVDMPDTVTKIGGFAFQDCISLKRVHLPAALEKIVITTFKGCIGLEELNIPDRVQDLKKDTLSSCFRLKRLYIGKNLRSLNMQAFARERFGTYWGRTYEQDLDIQEITVDPQNPYMKAENAAILSGDGKTLQTLLSAPRVFAVPEGVEEIGDQAFYGRTALTDISFPSTLRRIGEQAFAYTGIRSVAFGENLREIGRRAFRGCEKLSSALFPEGLEEIGEEAFCDSPISTVVLPSTLRKLGRDSFIQLYGYHHEFEQTIRIENNIHLRADGMALYQLDGEKTLSCFFNHVAASYTVEPDTVCIGEAAFRYMSELQSVVLPSSLREIGSEAFYGCTSLKSMDLPLGLAVIGPDAFKSCSLMDILIPASVTEIGTGAFSMEDIYYVGDGDEAAWQRKRTIKVDPANPHFYVEDNCLIQRGNGGQNAVVAHFGRADEAHIPGDANEILAQAFCGSVVRTVWIPASVTSIGEDAFQDCKFLTRLYIERQEGGAGMYAVVYFPESTTRPPKEDYDPDADEDEDISEDQPEDYYSDWYIRRQYMDCIRVGAGGSIFDFVKYDSLFPNIRVSKDKILIATDRLKSARDLVPLYREQYLTYLQQNAAEAVQVVIQYDDLAGLNTLSEIGVFTGENIDQVIELAATAQKADIQSFLMDYKNRAIGIQETDYDL